MIKTYSYGQFVDGTFTMELNTKGTGRFGCRQLELPSTRLSALTRRDALWCSSQ